MSTIDINDANPATAMRREIRVMAQMRDVFTGSKRGIHDSFALLKGYVSAIQSECFFGAHFSYLM